MRIEDKNNKESQLNSLLEDFDRDCGVVGTKVILAEIEKSSDRKNDCSFNKAI